MRMFCVAVLLAGMLQSPSRAEEKAKATVLVRGVHCEACVAAIRKSLERVKGVAVDAEMVHIGKKPRYFTEPFPVEVGNSLETGIGALAKATAEAKTPHADDIPPRLNLVLYTEQRIDEPAVIALRAALRDVNGVLVQESGGLGGMPNRGIYWIRLEPAGGADLHTIFKAAKLAVDVTLTDD